MNLMPLTTQTKMASRGRSARIKGHAEERTGATMWRDEMGFPDVMTTRYAGNPLLDSLGIDLVNTQPFGCQYHRGESFLISKFFDLVNNLPELEKQGYQIPLYIQKMNKKPRTVTMRWEDFVFLARNILP